MTANHIPEAQGSKTTKYIIIIGVFFFIFGFISWINGTLIPYLRIACELEEWQTYLVTFAFYISYTVMAIPSSGLLARTGMIKGMSIGLGVMALGCLFFIPAAYTRNYVLFLVGLFWVGTGLTLLQTAVNPYITLLGPADTAAKRISMMGICNKVAGILAPLVMGSIILKNANDLVNELAQMNAVEKAARLDQLSQSVVIPYAVLAGILLLIAVLIRFAHLPEMIPEKIVEAGLSADTSAKIKRQYLLGFAAIFCCVGAEVLAGDSIGNYGLYHGLGLDISKSLTSYTLAAMMAGYIFGVAVIPKTLSQHKAFFFSSVGGLIITILIVISPGILSLIFLALLGFCNALLWPAIWPQALKGLQGKQLAKGSAILIMGIAGGALLPLIYGAFGKFSNNQVAYLLLVPVYFFLIYYSYAGKRSSQKENIV
jgi:FHS family L-fucose permease-like MFS transporter